MKKKIIFVVNDEDIKIGKTLVLDSTILIANQIPLSTKLFTLNYETMYLHLRNYVPISTKSFTYIYESVYLKTHNYLYINTLGKM